MKFSRRVRNGAVAMVILAALPAASFAQAAPAKKTLLVAADGSGQFKTVQEAVDSAPGGNVRIEIKPGEYRQVVSITANEVELRGLGRAPQDVVLVFDNSHTSAGGTGKSATVTVSGDDFRAENLTLANDFERRHARTEEGSQAVALHVSGDREVFRRVRFLGFQDTLYADSKFCHPAPDALTSGGGTTTEATCHASRQYFVDCYIEGHVDFIFGDAKAVFDRCEIRAMAHPVVTITAQSRLRPGEDSGYLFRDCNVTAEPGAADILLGRPWRAYSTVVFMNTDFKAALDPKGWMEWGDRLKTSDYEEFGSKGMAGDVIKRIAPSRQLSAAEAAKLTVKAWLGGTDGWDAEKVR